MRIVDCDKGIYGGDGEGKGRMASIDIANGTPYLPERRCNEGRSATGGVRV